MPTKTIAKPIETDAVTTTIESAAADVNTTIESVTATQAKTTEKVMQSAKDLAAFNKGTMEAFSEATKIFATGSQELFKQMTECSQAGFAEAVAGYRALIAAKTVKERLELQSTLSHTAAVWAVSEANRFAQASIDLAGKATAPLTARAALAAETMTSAKI